MLDYDFKAPPRDPLDRARIGRTAIKAACEAWIARAPRSRAELDDPFWRSRQIRDCLDAMWPWIKDQGVADDDYDGKLAAINRFCEGLEDGSINVQPDA